MADSKTAIDQILRLFNDAAVGAPVADDYRVLPAEDIIRPAGKVWIGIDSQGRQVALLETEKLSEIEKYWISRVIEVLPRRVELPDGRIAPVIRLLCIDRNLAQVFATFIGDVLQREPDTSNLASALSRSAKDWRELLSRASSGLSDSEALGLYGELRFLEELVAELGPRALDLWAGDRRERHDFSGARGSVEIKTTKRQTQSTVAVHGLSQMLPPEQGFLALVVAEVDQSASGEDLGEVLTRLVDKGCDAVRVRSIMHSLGWMSSDEASEQTASHRFSLRGWRTWIIDSSSPVLSLDTVPEQIADAVSNVSYSLSLSALGEPAADFAPESIEAAP